MPVPWMRHGFVCVSGAGWVTWKTEREKLPTAISLVWGVVYLKVKIDGWPIPKGRDL